MFCSRNIIESTWKYPDRRCYDKYSDHAFFVALEPSERTQSLVKNRPPHAHFSTDENPKEGISEKLFLPSSVWLFGTQMGSGKKIYGTPGWRLEVGFGFFQQKFDGNPKSRLLSPLSGHFWPLVQKNSLLSAMKTVFRSNPPPQSLLFVSYRLELPGSFKNPLVGSEKYTLTTVFFFIWEMDESTPRRIESLCNTQKNPYCQCSFHSTGLANNFFFIWGIEAISCFHAWW